MHSGLLPGKYLHSWARPSHFLENIPIHVVNITVGYGMPDKKPQKVPPAARPISTLIHRGGGGTNIAVGYGMGNIAVSEPL